MASSRTAYEAAAIDVKILAGVDIRTMFAAALPEITNRTAKTVVALCEAFADGLTDDSKTNQIHQRLGAGAQQAVVASYLGYRRSGGPSGYRVNDRGRNKRYAGGALLRVLQADSFYAADPHSLALIDVEALDTRAKQWKRMNFGAGAYGQASPPSRKFPIEMSDQALAVLGLTEGPRPGFLMPKGIWLSESMADGSMSEAKQSVHSAGQDEFHPLPRARNKRARKSAMIATKGIRAEHFLDNGLAFVAERLPREYLEYVKVLTANPKVRQVRASSRVKVNGPVHKAPRIRRVLSADELRL